MTPTILTTLRFPELRLPMREGHRLRGYFGTAFKDSNPLLHNHLKDGATRQGYSLVQYKILDGIPTIVGIDEGSQAVTDIFADVNEIRLGNRVLPGDAKELHRRKFEVEILNDRLVEYRLRTPYCALNQDNYFVYRELPTDEERHRHLSKQLVNHLFAVCKGLGFYAESRIVAYPLFGQPHLTSLKGNQLTAFRGGFVTNLSIPDFIGIGKSTSRGFGAIERVNPGLGLVAGRSKINKREEE